MPEEEGELVGSGGFRVAGARALAVLRSAQLDGRFWPPLLWLRTAAALGAAKMTADAGRGRLTLVFDGRPLARALLADPLALFADGAAPPEARWLAYALVHTLGEDVTVRVSSGRGPDRRCFEFDAAGHGAPAQPAPGGGTVVQAAWPPLASSAPRGPWTWFPAGKDDALPRLEAADAVPFAFGTPLGDIIPWEKRKEPEAGVYRDEGRRVRVVLGGGRRLVLHHHGVRVGGSALEDLALPMSVDVDDPGLTLDASLNAPVEDHAYHRCVASGRAAAVRHGLARLEHHAKSMRLCAKLLLARPGLRRHWGAAMAAPERLDRRLPWVARALSAFDFRSVPGSDALRVARTAQFTAFLRAAAMSSLRGKAIDARLPLGLSLWDTPLLFSATGKPLSLTELDLDERPCSLWEENAPAPAGAGAMMVWAFCAADGAFAKGFPRRGARVS